MCSEVIFRPYAGFEMCFQGDLELIPKAAPVKNGSQCPERHPAPRAGRGLISVSIKQFIRNP